MMQKDIEYFKLYLAKEETNTMIHFSNLDNEDYNWLFKEPKEITLHFKQHRVHKKRRINKKWLKKYGYDLIKENSNSKENK